MLQQYGGIYLDIDTYIIRPFAPLSLYSYDTVLAMEARTLNLLRGPNSDREMDPKGLCNAIIISRPDSLFIKRWLESYEGFDEKKWTEHSVVSRHELFGRRGVEADQARRCLGHWLNYILRLSLYYQIERSSGHYGVKIIFMRCTEAQSMTLKLPVNLRESAE